MPDNLSSNKRIAKNTIMLYIRMLLSIVVSLYTSRVVLNTLGVEDYGIYGVVGGIVAMFSFLNASMSGATSRFLTYEMGRGNFQRLKETFSSALIVHIAIAVIVFILSETIGLWFLIYKLVIPEERMFAAHVVYQLSIFSTMVSITQVPYNAAIISHEKMDIYAYVELLNVILKLIIVFFLPILGNDKLIVYASLVLAVSVLIAFIYRIYCIRHYKESIFHFVYKKELLYPMLSFSGWNLYGNMSVSWQQQGMNFLLNMFFGPVLNAASSIATTIQGVIIGLAGNAMMAFRPQIIKNYATKNFEKMNELIVMSIKFTLALFLMIAIPIYIKIDIILKLWLKIVPEYTADFFRLIIISNIFSVINNNLVISIHATGKIKQLSFITGSIHLISLIPMYIILKMNYTPSSIYVLLLLFSVFVMTSNLLILKRNMKTVKIVPILFESLKNILLALFVFIFTINIDSLFALKSDFVNLLVVSILSVSFYILCFILFQLNNRQRLSLLKKIVK